MITKRELQEKARHLNLNLGQTEKNYLQLITLYALAKIAPDQFVFKGGTALMMLHNLDRFSEDLDFTIKESATFNHEDFFKRLRQQLLYQDVDFEIEKKDVTPVSITFIIRYNGPLFDGTRQTTSKVELDLSERELVMLTTEMKRIVPSYQDVPTFYIQSMSLEEVFAEKIRAILTRNKARDVYDVDFLIAKGVSPRIDIINKKLSYYNKTFSKNDLEQAITIKKNIWSSELKNLLFQIPVFEDVKKKILEQF